MTQGLKALNRAQISNVEGTPGTAEAATEILFFESLSQLTQDKVFHMPVQDRGSLAKNIETPFQVSQMLEFEASGDLYDRMMIFIANNAVRGNITPTVPDTSNEPNLNLWTIEPTLGAGNTPDITNGIDTFTLEWGNQIQAYETPYIVTTSFEISGAANEQVTFSWNFFGRGKTETTFTGALSAPTNHQYFATNQARWYVDDSYANIGTTEKVGVLKGFTISFETMFTPRFTTSGGNLYFSGINEDSKALEVKLELYRDSTIFEAELDKFEAKDMSYQRIALFGQTELDSGQSNPPYIYFDAALKYIDWPELGDEDGAETIEVTAESFLDATASKQFGILIGTAMDAYAS